jgi:hypothetical protein
VSSVLLVDVMAESFVAKVIKVLRGWNLVGSAINVY